MSNRYKGGIISATPPTTTGGESGTASGAWTLEQQMQAQAAGLWPIQPLPKYIEDVFSTYLYTGNGSTQTITNGIDLAGEGGLVWIKQRSPVTDYIHNLYDTARGLSGGFGLRLQTNSANPQAITTGTLSSFNSNGFSLGDNVFVNNSPNTFVSWTFRKQPKFFDVVTYTGNGAVGYNIPHNLGSAPGFIIVKAYDGDNRNWFIYHRSLGATKHLVFTTAAETTQTDIWNDTEPTSAVFTVGDSSNVNQNGRPYVAYLFAHDAGGFGLSGSDNVISCGSFTAAGGGATVNLGYEPQWVLYKRTDATDDWKLTDSMRGMYAQTTADAPILYPNLSSAEATPDGLAPFVSATGFFFNGVQNFPGSDNGTYIYIAIRRGPMKVPESGTSVFAPTIGVAATPTFIGNFPVDFCIAGAKGGTDKWWQSDRLRGQQRLNSATADAESSATYVSFDNMTGCFTDPFNNYVGYVFRRAPGTFDEVCYTGTGSPMLINHNLGVPPELIITKRRNATSTIGWIVSSLYWFASTPWDRNGRLNQDGSLGGGGVYIPASSHSATQYPVDGAIPDINASSGTYVAYLWATNPGVTKVGIYTGNGSSQTINCGFTSGARFVMIKAASTTGNWLVADSARGIVAGNDPALYLNSTAAEITGFDWIDADSTGFVVNETATIAANTNGVQYIFLSYS